MPASARILVDKMLAIAHFDIIENSVAFGAIMEFPEENEDALKARFIESGYESAYMINLLGIGFIVIVVTFTIMFILLITYPLTKYYERVKTPHSKVSSSIFWGTWIRFLMEESLVAFMSVFCQLFKSNSCEGDLECEVATAIDTAIIGGEEEIQVSLGF